MSYRANQILRNYLIVLAIIFVVSLTMISLTPRAQLKSQKSKGSRLPRVSKPKAQPTPQSTPTPTPTPQKSEVDLLVEKDVIALSTLTDEQKASVRAALEALDKNVRVYELRGYDSTFLIGLEMDGVEKVVQKGFEALPASTLKNLLTNSWVNLLDAWSADNYYRRNYGDKEFLELIDRYQMQGQPASLVGSRILECASKRLAVAKRIAAQIGVVQSQ